MNFYSFQLQKATCLTRQQTRISTLLSWRSPSSRVLKIRVTKRLLNINFFAPLIWSDATTFYRTSNTILFGYARRAKCSCWAKNRLWITQRLVNQPWYLKQTFPKKRASNNSIIPTVFVQHIIQPCDGFILFYLYYTYETNLSKFVNQTNPGLYCIAIYLNK